jgi:hypothetical protein
MQTPSEQVNSEELQELRDREMACKEETPNVEKYKLLNVL